MLFHLCLRSNIINYSFVLKDESGNVIQTVQNNGGSIAFNTLSFSKTGTFHYTISEVPGNDSTINYDTAVYKVIVEVTKSGDYRATVSYEKDGAEYDGIPVFANTTKPAGDDTISVSVNKVWNDNHNAIRPASVTVQLYRDGVAYGSAVTLSADNGWRYAWIDLDENASWTVDEAGVPNGYGKSVTHSGNNWTITYTLKVQDTPDAPPSNPDKPTPPPVNPPKPPVDRVPQTGDSTNLSLWLALAGFSLLGAIVAAFGKKRLTRRSK